VVIGFKKSVVLNCYLTGIWKKKLKHTDKVTKTGIISCMKMEPRHRVYDNQAFYPQGMTFLQHYSQRITKAALLSRRIKFHSSMDSKYKEHKHPLFGDLPLSTSGPLEVALEGLPLLQNPYFNKGSAFTDKERDAFDLHGLLPVNVQTLKEQVDRAYHQFSTRESDLAKNTFMTSMKMQNVVLFYKVRL
jgi:hypothetical protein